MKVIYKDDKISVTLKKVGKAELIYISDKYSQRHISFTKEQMDGIIKSYIGDYKASIRKPIKKIHDMVRNFLDELECED